MTSGIATVFSQIWRRLPAETTWVLAPRLPGFGAVDKSFPTPVKRVWLPVGESGLSKILKTKLTLAWCLWFTFTLRPARIHCGQVFSSGIVGWILSSLFNVPYTVWVYGSETVRLGAGGLSRRLMTEILSRADRIVTNSNATSEEFRQFGVPDAKLLRIYPGVDSTLFVPRQRDPEFVSRFALLGKRVLLTVARLDQRKGHDTVLRALRRLPDDVVYLIAGAGREEHQLRILATKAGVEKRVHFLGFVPDADLPKVYNLCDIFVMPNRTTKSTALEGDIEGFGITFIEAGACGKPVVGGKSGGAVEAVLDGETGILVEHPADANEVEVAIRTLLDDEDLRSRMGTLARQRAVREFDWDKIARSLEPFLV